MDWLLGLENAYDVMGLAPDATDDEIEAEFEMLVRRKGYRVGLRRSSWRQRLSEIKAAYATLSDPVKRRAYDRSLGVSADPSVWRPMSRSDEFSDSLVRPATRRKRAPASGAAGLLGGAAAVSDGAGPPVWPDAPRDSDRKRQRDEALAENVAASEPTSAADHVGDASDLDEGPAARRGQAKTLAIGAALTLGLGAILFASWQQEAPRQSAPKRSQSPASAQPRTSIAPFAEPSPATVAGVAATSELTPEEQAAAAGDARAASASLSHWQDTEEAATAGTPALAPAGPSANAGAGPVASPPVPDAAAPVANPAPAAAIRTDAPAQVAARETSSESLAPSPPPAVAAPQVNSKISVSLPAHADAVRPPKLISGAPSDADNRRGQYRGSLVVQFTIGREGRVADCAIARTSGDAKLDALTCRILEKRARFTPAQDAQGSPVPSVANATYVWGRGHRAKK